jgi:hypothetical protein
MQRLLLLFLALFLVPISSSDTQVREMQTVLPPASDRIRYSDFFIGAPGWLDLSSLTFATVDDGGGGPVRLDGDTPEPAEFFQVDVVIFRQPDSCREPGECDWAGLGFGAPLRYCCNQDAIQLGLCTEDRAGRLIIHSSFVGKHRFSSFSSAGGKETQLEDARFEYDLADNVDESGHYIVVFANCNDQGLPVLVTGEIQWMSSSKDDNKGKLGLTWKQSVLVFAGALVVTGLILQYRRRSAKQVYTNVVSVNVDTEIENCFLEDITDWKDGNTVRFQID